METIQLQNGQRLKLIQDVDAADPRKEWDNLGEMVCRAHRRYELGDRQIDPQDFDPSKEFAVYLPLYVYEHGGITMSTGAFDCQWDSGQAGWIGVTREKLVAEYGDDSEQSREKALRCLKGEVETYDQYLRGDVYGFQLLKVETCNLGHEHEEEVESCWGFFGHDPLTNGMVEHLPDEVVSQLKK